MRQFTGWVISLIFLTLGISIPPRVVTADPVEVPQINIVSVFGPSAAARTPDVSVPAPITFKHGDVSWLPELALKAGWELHQIPKLAHIILRESGGCPARQGGDIVDKNCVITGVSTWKHRSDSGLLQLNGVHWKKDHPNYAGLICKRMKICTQEPLFDALTNLRAGRLLFDAVGWAPWDPCYWGPKFAARCEADSHSHP